MNSELQPNKGQIPNPVSGGVVVSVEKLVELLQSKGSNIPVEKLIDLLKKNESNVNGRSPLIRAKSDPISGVLSPSSKRKSIPQVFIFPDVKENPSLDSDTPHQSSGSLSIDGLKEGHQSDVSGSGRPSESMEGSPRQDVYMQKLELMPMSLSYEDRQPSKNEVSEVYFKNVVNELVKTKMYLKDLQSQHKLLLQEKSENGLLKKELHQLRFTAQLLQREHRKMMEQNKKLKLKLNAYQPPGMNESFELGTPGEIEFCEKESQTDPDMVGSYTDTMLRIWQQAMEDCRKENVDLTRQYNELKNNVKILNSCLQEEKTKNRQMDKDLHSMDKKRREAFSQLALRRQELDELKQEYGALKKTLHISEHDHSQHNSSRYSSRLSSRQTTPSSRTSSRSNSGDQILLNIQPQQCHRRHSSQHTATRTGQNDLSSINDEERAPSNLALPFSRHTSHGEVEISQGSSESIILSHRQGTEETQPHSELPCPACLQTFQDDGSYLHHLQKCMPY